MNLKPYLTFARTGAFAVGVFAFVLFSSWIAGQCRQWRTPKPFPPLVDVGAPVAGPSSAAPTIMAPLEIARPDLTVDELREVAKKYGLQLATLAPAASKPSGPASGPADVLPQKEANIVAQNFPMLLAEESFKHAPSGVNLEVAAWLPGWGERVDLRARFLEWTPPPVVAAKIPVCQSGSFFANEAKWVKEVGAGYVYGGGKAGPGAWASAAYRGPRTGAVTWGGRAFGAFSAESGAVGVGGFTASW